MKNTNHRKTDTANAGTKPRSHHRRVAADADDRADIDSSEPLEGEVIRTSRTNGRATKSSTIFSNAARWVASVLPAADGGPPPVVTAARTRFSGFIWAGIGLIAGCIAGALVVLLATGMPNVPMVLLGLSAGAMLGASVALVFASRFPLIRKFGAFAILLAPLLLLAAPFLLLAGGVALLMRFPKRGAARK